MVNIKYCYEINSKSKGFINLGTKIPMTVPVSRKNIDIDEESLEMEMSFYLNVEEPPEPKNPNLYISKREEISVYTR